MFNNTHFKSDTVVINSELNKDTQYINYMYDYISGVRNIRETVSISLSDSIKEYTAFFADNRLYKIYVIGYRKSDIGKRADYAASLYYFDGNTLLSKSEDKLSLDLTTCREHFEQLAKRFNNTLKIK